MLRTEIQLQLIHLERLFLDAFGANGFEKGGCTKNSIASFQLKTTQKKAFRPLPIVSSPPVKHILSVSPLLVDPLFQIHRDSIRKTTTIMMDSGLDSGEENDYLRSYKTIVTKLKKK